jgi:hypothetical protein
MTGIRRARVVGDTHVGWTVVVDMNLMPVVRKVRVGTLFPPLYYGFTFQGIGIRSKWKVRGSIA